MSVKAVASSSVAADPVPELLTRARKAMATYAAEIAEHGQPRIDEAVTALAWSIYKPETARKLAEIAVEVTGIGEVESKVIKNQRKTFGTLRDLLRVRSTGIIEELPEKGLVKWAKPVGVVAAISPSTNPSATPVNKAMMALKGGNAIIIAPPPRPAAKTGSAANTPPASGRPASGSKRWTTRAANNLGRSPGIGSCISIHTVSCSASGVGDEMNSPPALISRW